MFGGKRCIIDTEVTLNTHSVSTPPDLEDETTLSISTTTLTKIVTTGLRRTQIRVHRAEVHEAGEGDGPGVNDID